MSSSDKQDAQRILKIVDQLQKFQQESDQEENSQILVKSFIQNFMDEEQDLNDISEQVYKFLMIHMKFQEQVKLMGKAFEKLFDCLQLMSHEYKQTLTKIQRPQSSNQKISGITGFDSTIAQVGKVIRIQAWWRKVFTMKKLRYQIDQERANLTNKRDQDAPEEAALKEFATQLSRKKITPEAFFRICDPDYKQCVRVDVFKDYLQKFGIQLSRGQLSRLIMILDEDVEGTITREEYYNGLEAYNVSGEKHKSQDGTSVYYQFEYKALFKLINELRNKDISFVQMFNACDLNDDVRINIHEVRKFVEGLNPDFKQKEVHALMNYLDIDKNGLIDRDEFIRQLTRGEQTYKQSLALQKSQQFDRPQSAVTESRGNSAQKQFFQNRNEQVVQENNFFDEESVDHGDQAFYSNWFGSSEKTQPAAQNTAQNQRPVTADTKQQKLQQNSMLLPDINNKKSVQGKQPVQATQQQSQVKSFMSKVQNEAEAFKKRVVTKMETEGQSVSGFFSSLRTKQVGGEVPLGTVLQHMEQSHPTIPMKDKYELIKDCIKNDSKVDYVKLEETFTRHSKSMKPSESQVFSVIANNIVKRMNQGSSNDCIKSYFRAQGINQTDAMSEMEFIQLFGDKKFSTLQREELALAFRSLNIDLDGFIHVNDLVEVLISYVSSSADNLQINTKDLGKIIPGFESMSPRTRIEELVEYIIGELKKKNLKPLNAFKMAVTKDQNAVSSLLLEQTFFKLLPHVKQEIFSEAMNAFKLNGPRDIINRADFETVFHEYQPDTNSYIPNSSSYPKGKLDFMSGSKTSLKSQPIIEEDESIRLIRKLDNSMLREGLSPAVAFKAADMNHNGVVTVDELREAVKKFIPDQVLNLADLKKIIMAFDINKNGLIEESEFINLIEKARNSNITVIESPQKGSRILQNSQMQEDYQSDRKSKLPLKQNQGNQPIQQKTNIPDETQLIQIIQQLEAKVNMKKFFGQLFLQDNGSISVSSIGQKFKTEKAQNGQSFSPEIYIGVIRYLDSQNRGEADVKFLLKFCDQYLKVTNKTDVTLELKYIANLLEFQKGMRSTKQFFEINSTLKPAIRIKEVEILSEFSKLFGTSTTQGPILFKHFDTLKMGKELFLEDICKQIDQYRILQPDNKQLQGGIPQTQASKLNPQQTVLQFVIKLIGLTSARYERINQRLNEIFTQEKGLFYNQVFNVFVTDYELLQNQESKAFFEYMKQQSQIQNGIDIATYYQVTAQFIEKIKAAQEEAFKSIVDQNSPKFFEFLNKVRMNELGYISKTSLKEQIGLFFNSINGINNTNIQNTAFVVQIRRILQLDMQFQFPEIFQPIELISDELFEQLENCQFWIVVELLSKLTSLKEPIDELIYKFFGKLFDNLATNKSTFSVIQQVCPEFTNLRNSPSLFQMIVKLYTHAQKAIKGSVFEHEQIYASVQKQADLIWQKLGSKPIQMQNDENILIQKINRHRGKLPVGQKMLNLQEEKVQNGDQGTLIENSNQLTQQELQLIQQIERQMQSSIENAIDHKFFEDILTVIVFQKLLQQSGQVERNLSAQLSRTLDSKQQGKISIKNVTFYLQKVPGKYDKQQIDEQIKNIQDPFEETLEAQGFVPKEQFSKEEFYNQLTNLINISIFHSVCLFYELCESENDTVIEGANFIRYVQKIKNQNKAQNNNNQRTAIQNKNEPASQNQLNSSIGKKSVQFKEQNEEFIIKENNQEKDDQNSSIALAQQFIQLQQKVLNVQTIQSTFQKMAQVLSQAKNTGEALAIISPNKKLQPFANEIKTKLDEIQSLTNEEKLIVIFIGLDFDQADKCIIDIASVIPLFKTYKSNNQNTILEAQANLQRSIECLSDNLKLQQNVQQQVVQKKQEIPKQQQKPSQQEFKLADIKPKSEINQSVSGTNTLSNLKASFKVAGGNLNQSQIDEFHDTRIQQMSTILPLLIKGFSNSQVLAKFLQILQVNNGHLSQFQFFNFIQQELGIKGPTEEIDWLAYEFDEFSEVELNPENLKNFFDEFRIPIQIVPSQYKFITKEQIKQKFLEKNEYDTQNNYKEEEVNIDDIITYKINPKVDYYRGIPTILNSELAALAQAHRIYEQLGPLEEYLDLDFGPKDANDIKGNSLAIYCTGEPPARQFIDPSQLEWLRPEDYLDPGQKPQFIDDDFSAADVKQGNLGDCWFISALSILATRDELLMGDLNVQVKQNFKVKGEDVDKLSKGVYPPIFHQYRKKGMYVIRFFKNFQWRYVIIDERLPCKKSDYRPYYATCKNLNELWVPLIEKAYAKLHGCYQALLSGYIDDGIAELTGLVSEKLKLHNEQNLFPHKSLGDKEKFWEYLMSKKAISLMGCSSSGETEGQIKYEGRPCGVMSGHAYAVIDAFEVPNATLEKERKTHRLLRVRNPWGQTEWQGKWSDFSEEMVQTRKDVIEEYFRNHLEEEVDERFKFGENDGTFLINYASWRDIFNNFFMTFDFPDAWNAIRCVSEWNQTCCGGTPSPMNEENMISWAKNPQFLFAPKNKTSLFISLAQIDGRARQKDGQGGYLYYKYPFVEVIAPICFMVYELEPGKSKVEKFDKAKIKLISIIRESREVSQKIELEGGKSYVIVVSTKGKEDYGKFYLSLYFDQKLRDVNVKRIDDPSTKFYDIEEETENYDLIPKWKKLLVQQRMKYMITGGEDMEGMDESILGASGKYKLGDIMRRGTVKGGGQDNSNNFSPNTSLQKGMRSQQDEYNDDVME